MRRASFPARRTFATGSATCASDSTDSTPAPAILRGSCSATSTVTSALLKHAVVELARESSKRVIREGLVPSEAGGRRIGPAYTDEVIQYVRRRWSPNRARAASPSLARAFERCETFSRRGTWS